MRRFEQKKILELLRTLDEANAEMKQLFLQGEVSSVLQVLADCQEFVAAISNFIEKVEGEATQAVALLGEYYGLLYEASLAVENEEGDKFWKRLKKQWIKIENSVKAGLKPNKLEVVFFPYNASMWDSLESVWLAAVDDPCCEVYVVPIPYFEITPDGKPGKMYYDGERYPENVPITDWREYDIEARHPDVAFIHYAYDDTGSNASIHPDFYSKRLREYCDLLVYIPYFVVAGAYMEGYYTTLPGVLYADRVVLQSEEQRQAYIEQYKQDDKLNGWNGRYGNPMEKFVALGSPKFDKVLKAKRDDYALPESWERLIYRKDGTRKKVIFYNTHMFTWLNGGEPYFKKLESVFEFFRIRDDVVLWWRPHPNTELNFRRFRPELFDRYRQVVQEYKEAGWGIYDDSSDLHRAITVSDAYYGDTSSVIELYKQTGKKILQQYIYIQHYEQRLVLSTHLYYDGAYFWSTAAHFNGLYKINTKTFKPEFVGRFPNVKVDGQFLFSAPVECNGKLYFSPFNADGIGVYDKRSGEFSFIPLSRKLFGHPRKFDTAFVYGNFIFFIGYYIYCIMKLDIETHKITYIDSWLNCLPQIQAPQRKSLAHLGRGCQIEEKLYIPAMNARCLLVFDMRDCRSEVDDLQESYFSARYDGENLWLTPYTHSAPAKYNITTKKLTQYRDVEYQIRNSVAVCVHSGFAYFFSYYENRLLKIDIHTDSVRVYGEAQGALSGWIGFAVDEKIYLTSHHQGRLVEIEPESMDIVAHELFYHLTELPDSAYDAIFSEMEGMNGYVTEDNFMNLDMFIKVIDRKSLQEKSMKGNNGEMIYKSMKGLIL